MPRPERVLDPTSGPVQAFAAELRELRHLAGSPKYLQMARATGRSRTALAEAAGGDHLPTWETTEAYVRACQGDTRAWRLKWEAVQEQIGRFPQTYTDFEEPAKRRVLPQQEIALKSAPLAVDPNDPLGPTNAEGSSLVLLQMWQEQRTQARQCENNRAFITAVIIASGALVYALTPQKGSGLPSLLTAMVLCMLGALGSLMMAKYYERHQMHMNGAETLRRRLDMLFPELHIEDDWLSSRRRHKQRYTRLYRLQLHHLWIVVHLGIVACGLLLLVTTLTW